MTTDISREELKITTPKFRGSFVTLNRPRAMGDGDPKFSVTLVLKEDDPFWKKLQGVIDKAALKKFDGKIPRNLKSPIRHGDETEYEDWADCKFASLTSTERPGCVKVEDGALEDVEDRSELYSGAWYRATIRAYGWFFKQGNKKGVSLNLDNVLKVRDDEPFSGRSSATDDFADYVDAGDADDDGDDAESLLG